MVFMRHLLTPISPLSDRPAATVFPAFRFDVRSNDISSANAPVFLVCMCVLLTLLWSIVAAVVAPALGLGVSGALK